MNLHLTFTLVALLFIIGVSAQDSYLNRRVAEPVPQRDTFKPPPPPPIVTKTVTAYTKTVYITQYTLTLTEFTYTVTTTFIGTCTSTPCDNPATISIFTGEIVPPPAATSVPDYVKELKFGPGWAHIPCGTYCSSNCPEQLPFCDPSCSNKGTCGKSSRTNLLLGPLLTDPTNPGYSIIPAPPSRSFKLFSFTVTAGILDFHPQYSFINFEVRSWDRKGTPNPVKLFAIRRPPTGVYYSDTLVDLGLAGIREVTKLEFLAWHEGSIGKGGQGPGGRFLAVVKLDGNGLGGAIGYEAYTWVC